MRRHNSTLVIAGMEGAGDIQARANAIDLSSVFDVSPATHGSTALFMGALDSGCLQSDTAITRPMFLSPPDRGSFHLPTGGLDIVSSCAVFGGGIAGIAGARSNAAAGATPSAVPTATELVVGTGVRSPALATAAPFVSFNNLAGNK